MAWARRRLSQIVQPVWCGAQAVNTAPPLVYLHVGGSSSLIGGSLLHAAELNPCPLPPTAYPAGPQVQPLTWHPNRAMLRSPAPSVEAAAALLLACNAASSGSADTAAPRARSAFRGTLLERRRPSPRTTAAACMGKRRRSLEAEEEAGSDTGLSRCTPGALTEAAARSAAAQRFLAACQRAGTGGRGVSSAAGSASTCLASHWCATLAVP